MVFNIIDVNMLLLSVCCLCRWFQRPLSVDLSASGRMCVYDAEGRALA